MSLSTSRVPFSPAAHMRRCSNHVAMPHNNSTGFLLTEVKTAGVPGLIEEDTEHSHHLR